MDSEWDEAKRQANILKHGIDFVDAIEIFTARFIETEDRRRDYRERRYRATGLLGDQIIQVAYTWRGERRRIISARRTRRNDRRAYHASYPGAGQTDEKSN
jgi:uncharacterized DUF497 family protein